MKNTSPVLCTLLPLMLSAGCAQPLKPADHSPDYFTDASACEKQSQTPAKVRINLGNVSDMELPAGVDGKQYRICMETLGWKVVPAKDPFLSLAETCRQAALKPIATDSADPTKLNSDFDSALYESCIHNKGVKGTVIVLPIKPDTQE